MLCFWLILQGGGIQLQLPGEIVLTVTTKVLCFNLNESGQGCSIVQIFAGLCLRKEEYFVLR